MSKEAIEALESARAHILDAYRIWQADDDEAVPPLLSGAGAVIAKIDAVLSTLPIAGEVKVTDELLSLIPDEIDIPPMTDRGVAGQVLDVAWPLCGGNHQDADFWNIFSFAVNLTLRVSSPGGGQDTAIDADSELLEVLKELCTRIGPRWFLEQNWAAPLDVIAKAEATE